jgi:hypothetical protein
MGTGITALWQGPFIECEGKTSLPPRRRIANIFHGRYVVEQTFGLLDQFCRVRVRYETMGRSFKSCRFLVLAAIANGDFAFKDRDVEATGAPRHPCSAGWQRRDATERPEISRNAFRVSRSSGTHIPTLLTRRGSIAGASARTSCATSMLE